MNAVQTIGAIGTIAATGAGARVALRASERPASEHPGTEHAVGVTLGLVAMGTTCVASSRAIATSSKPVALLSIAGFAASLLGGMELGERL